MASFQPVFDSRKRKVPGLWLRGERYYAQLRVDLGNGRTAPRRLPLAATTLDGARGELERKKTERRDGRLPRTGHRPKFSDFAPEYLTSPTLTSKKDRTQTSERQAITRWVNHLGEVRLDKIAPAHVFSYRDKRLASGTAARTVNLDAIALRNVLKLAHEREHIERLPEFRRLKQNPPPKKTLLTKVQLAKLLSAANVDATKNADLFRSYLQFLAVTGAREKEALAVRWADVDFEREIVTIGSGGAAKNHRSRDVDFSPDLTNLLRSMQANRPPDSSWLFPSSQRGARNVASQTLRESLLRVRVRAGLPKVGFHDLRHFFASECVMAGLDFMTIASWLGHSNGGILVGKVYGHLADIHKKAAAQKLRFLEKTNA